MKRIPIPPEHDLYRMYITEQKSSYRIAEIIGCSSETVLRWLHEHKISVRTSGRPRVPPKRMSPRNEILKQTEEILEEHVTNVPTKETEYMEYIETPTTTKELMAHFGAEKNAAWQMMRTLRLKKLAHRTRNGFWKITEDGDDVPLIPVTPLQTRYIKYLRAPHSTKDMMAEFGQNVSAVQQVTRTLRLMEYVEAVGRGSQQGKGGCWKMWKTTDKGLDVI